VPSPLGRLPKHELKKSRMPGQDSRKPRAESGVSIVEGLAIGRAIVWASDPRPPSMGGTLEEEQARLARAVSWAIRGVEELVRLLPRSEAELFEPEVVMLDELSPTLRRRVDEGARAEQAVNDATSGVPTDLLTDARARLLDGLALDQRSVESLLEGRDGDRVLVSESLTPSVVASLPSRVVGVLAAADADLERRGTAHASHAAILARGRDIALALGPASLIRSIANDDDVILDTTVDPASICLTPDEPRVMQAFARQKEWAHKRAEEEAKVAAPLAHLGVEVHVNVGSLYERIPTSADGIGLVRTELLFSDRRIAPSVVEQVGALRVIAARVGRTPVTVRLFDAGCDKPISWLQAPKGLPDARGIGLLLAYPELLVQQLKAIERAGERGNVRVLLPFVTRGDEVQQVRARSNGRLPIGAMVETPDAVDRVDEIVSVADFVSIGTNDLFAAVTGKPRATSALSLDAVVLTMIERVIANSHAHGRKVTVCGEMAGEPHCARILVGLGVDAISVAPVHLGKVKLALRDVSIDDCLQVARSAMK
jgi:multiphosphoryl transfer protein